MIVVSPKYKEGAIKLNKFEYLNVYLLSPEDIIVSKITRLEHFIYLLNKNINKYPNFKSFLWSLESRGIYGKDYNVLAGEEFSELQKIVNMFLKLSYWG